MRRSAHRRSSPFLVTSLVTTALCLTAPAAAQGPTTPLAETGRGVDFGTAHRPGGGYLLAWQDPSTLRLRVRRVSENGFPQGEVRGLPELPFDVRDPALAVSPSGRWLAVWTQPAGADQVGLAGALFDADDHLLRSFELPDPIPDPGGLVISFGARVAALPAGGFAVAFTIGIQDDPLEDPLDPSDTDAYLLRLDDDGFQVGAAVRIHDDQPEFQVATDVGASTAGIVVAWTAWSRDLDDDPHALVRVFTSTLSPISGETVADQSPIPSDGSQGYADLEVGSDGRFVVAWEGARPEGGRDVLMRPYGADGGPSGGEASVASAVGDPTARPRVAVTGGDEVWIAWLRFTDLPASPLPLPLVVARRFDLSGTPQEQEVSLGGSDGGDFALTNGEESALAAWRLPFGSSTVVGAVVGLPPEATLPPPELGLESPEVPGFRVWARIAQGAGAFRFGTETTPCLAEALCAAGALPDRAELIVRVVGPKPNGFLWPTLVKLSTSQIEVWIEQLSTGAVRYYVLPGATPGSEMLPGRFDRDGFRP